MKYVHYKYFNNDSINWKEEWILLEDESLEWILEFLREKHQTFEIEEEDWYYQSERTYFPAEIILLNIIR